jgi:hypothetical protein
MKQYYLKLTFTAPILGTVPKDKEVYASYIATHEALTDEDIAKELESVEQIEEKGWTGFHTDDRGPFLLSYMIKGFFKDACGMLRRATGTSSKKLTAYKKVIDGLVFVEPDELLLNLPTGQELGMLERPLRAQTAQGERVALARSDSAPAGTSIEFNLLILGGVSHKLLIEWLEYGKLRGLGQWRNAGWGRFSYELTER